MFARLFIAGTIVLAAMTPALADGGATFAQVDVTAKVASPHIGVDSGLSFSQSGVVRISASGSITLPNGACASPISPDGCGIDSTAVPLAGAHRLAPGTLIAAFADSNDSLVTNWTPVGSFSSLVVPARATHLLFSLNGVSGSGSGSFHVVTNLAPALPHLRSLASAGRASLESKRRTLSDAATAAPTTPGSSFNDVEYLLRRLGFSDTPEDVNTIIAEAAKAGTTGANYWLAQQTNPSLKECNPNAIEPLPGPTMNFIDQDAYYIYREINLDLSSCQQLRQKMTWYWMNFYSVAQSKIDAADGRAFNGTTMEQYVETLRKDGLGNWAQLMTEVAKSPAMMIWLDNGNNAGGNPGVPPNENFARELLQLYTMGPNTLHGDGTPYTDFHGNPLPRYTDSDVKTLARALSGFTVNDYIWNYPWNMGAYPNLSESIAYVPANHSGTAAPLSTNLLSNGSFSTPSVNGGYLYNPTGGTWAFQPESSSGSYIGGSGITANGTLLTHSNPSAPSTQVAFIQGASSMTETVTLPAGSYVFTVNLAGRNGYNGADAINLTVDGANQQLLGGTISKQNYSQFQSYFTIATAGPHTLKLVGTDNSRYNMTFLANASLFQANIAPTWSIIDHDHTFADPGNANGQPGQPQCAWNLNTGSSGPCVVDNLIKVLAKDPVVAAFQAKRMIQFFANENPSTHYVYRIANVWRATVNDSNQIAEVITAIAQDPEFYSDATRHNMVKDTLEYQLDAIRELGGAFQNSPPNVSNLNNLSPQWIFNPPSVFGFYLPGPYPNGKESLINTSSILQLWSVAGRLSEYPFGGCLGASCRSVDLGLPATYNVPITSTTQANAIASYLVNAMVDGGVNDNPGLVALLSNYIYGYPGNGSGPRISHALWILLTSPEYEVN